MYEVIKLQIKIRGQHARLHTPLRGSFINPKPLTIHQHSNHRGSWNLPLRLVYHCLQAYLSKQAQVPEGRARVFARPVFPPNFTASVPSAP